MGYFFSTDFSTIMIWKIYEYKFIANVPLACSSSSSCTVFILYFFQGFLYLCFKSSVYAKADEEYSNAGRCEQYLHNTCALCIYFMYIIPIPVLHRLVLFDRPAIMFPSPANKSLSLAPPLHAMSTLFNDHCPEDAADFVIFKIII